jgi:integrase/recombinase XerD
MEWLSDQDVSEESADEFLYELSYEKGLKNNSINSYINMLNHWCNFVNEYKIPGHPYTSKKYNVLPKNSTPIDPLSCEEIRAILNIDLKYGRSDACNLNQVYKTLIRFIAMTGCRFQEASKLKYTELDLINGKVIFRDTKNKDWRTVWITDPLTSEMKRLPKGNDDLVFINSWGHKIHPQDFSKDLRLRAEKAGITKRVHPHLFRHSYGSEIYEQTKDIYAVKTVLGHRDISCTERYIHVNGAKDAQMTHPMVMDTQEGEDLIKAIRTAIEKLPQIKSKKLDCHFDYGKDNLVVNIKVVPGNKLLLKATLKV